MVGKILADKWGKYYGNSLIVKEANLSLPQKVLIKQLLKKCFVLYKKGK